MMTPRRSARRRAQFVAKSGDELSEARCKSTNEFGVAVIRLVGSPVVDGEGVHDLRAAADGARPAGSQLMVCRELAELLPPRVGGDVNSNDGRAEMRIVGITGWAASKR